MNSILIRIVLLALACALLASCGNKGPLVLPDHEKTEKPADQH